MSKHNQFTFDECTYTYFCHPYNDTRHNERAIEIPVALNFIDSFRKNHRIKILEIGNVMSHYCLFPHQVIAEYEKSDITSDKLIFINDDVRNFESSIKYDFIFSISTIEHLGNSVTEHKDCISELIMKIRSLLDKDGIALLTFPLGVNTYIDNHIKKGDILFDSLLCMKRGEYNEWAQVPIEWVWDEEHSETVYMGDYSNVSCWMNYYKHIVFATIEGEK